MKKLLIKQFLPPDYEQILYQKYHRQSMPTSKSASEYIEEFLEARFESQHVGKRVPKGVSVYSGSKLTYSRTNRDWSNCGTLIKPTTLPSNKENLPILREPIQNIHITNESFPQSQPPITSQKFKLIPSFKTSLLLKRITHLLN